MAFFKKSYVLLICFFVLNIAYGQKEKRPVFVGVSGAFSTEVKNGGIGAFCSFHLTDHFRLAPGLTYFFPKTEELVDGEETFQLWEIFIDGQILFFDPSSSFNIYGLAGFNYAFITDKGYTEDPIDPTQKYHFDKNSYEPGLNLGLGFEVGFSNRVSGLLDVKYEISGFSQVIIRAGLAVKI